MFLIEICRLPAPINRLTVLDSSGSEQEFYREAPLTNGSITVFLGPGRLTHALALTLLELTHVQAL